MSGRDEGVGEEPGPAASVKTRAKPAAGARRSGREAAIAAALGIAAFLLFRAAWGDALHNGVSATGAWRVLQGEVPYRDFWTLYAPGHFYLLAALFKLFGPELLVSAIAGAALAAAAVAVTYHLARALELSRGVAVLVATVHALAFFATPYVKSLGTYPPAALGIGLALLCAARARGRGRRRALALAGVAAGVVALFKHDVGGYTALAIACGAATHELVAQGAARVRLARAARAVLRVGVAAAAVVAPVALVFAWLAGRDLVADLIVFPLTRFAAVRPEVYPSLLPGWVFEGRALKREIVLAGARYLEFALPLVGATAGLLALAAAARRGAAERAGTLAMLVAGFLLHHVAAHVQINTHIVSMTLYGVCAGALALREGIRVGSRGVARRLRLGASGLAVLWLAALVLRPALGVEGWWAMPRAAIGLPGTWGVETTPGWAALLRKLVGFVQQRVPPGEPVYVGTHRHDLVIVSDPMLYFLLRRRPAVRYHELHPGVADTAVVQREIVADLERRGVRLVVLKHAFPDARLDRIKPRFRRRVPEIGAEELDDYIHRRFEPVLQLDRYTVWIRRREPKRGS